MRIDALNQVSRLYGMNGTTAVKKSSKVAESDKLEISTFGKDLQVAKQAVAASSDVRTDKVNEYKNLIQQGKYEVSSEAFADKLLEEFGEVS